MKKNNLHIYIIITTIILILVILLIISILPKKKVLTCIIENDGSYNNIYQKYVFTGFDNIVELEERYCKIDDDENHEIINKYYEILKDDENVQDIKIVNDTIEWYEKRGMVNYENLDNCKDKNGNILFSKVKKYFDNMDYICNYSK